jgi:hypothetical protein
VEQFGDRGGDRRAEQRHGEQDHDQLAGAAAAAVGVGAVRDSHGWTPAGSGRLSAALD